MKKFIKGRWFPLSIAIIVVTALLVFLYCKGFRITYAPDLENSWDAVSAFAAWAGVVTSSVAIIIAILIPKRIAVRQDKIALFEKRLEIYDLLSSCSSSANILKVVDNNEDILKYLFIVFTDDSRKQNKFDSNEARLYLTNCSAKLQQAVFLFPEEVIPYITEVSIELLILANADVEKDEPERFDEKKQKYFEAISNFDQNKVLKRIRAEMTMF